MNIKLQLKMLLLVMAFCLTACANMKVESATLTDSLAAQATAEPLEPIDIAVNQYFSDDAARAKEAAAFLSEIGYQNAQIEIKNGLVSIRFEQFSDLLPEDMQARYLVAFQVAERFSPLCRQVKLTVMVEKEAFISLLGTCADVRAMRKGNLKPHLFLNGLEKQVLVNES